MSAPQQTLLNVTAPKIQSIVVTLSPQVSAPQLGLLEVATAKTGRSSHFIKNLIMYFVPVGDSAAAEPAGGGNGQDGAGGGVGAHER